jgi:hypothetical protein
MSCPIDINCSPPNGCKYCVKTSGESWHCGCAPCGDSDWIERLNLGDFEPGPPEEVILTVDFNELPLWVASYILNKFSTVEFAVPASRLNDSIELPVEEMPLLEMVERLGLIIL